MTPSQAKFLNTLRTVHNIDVCHFPVCTPTTAKQYKFYLRRESEVPWNPVNRNGEGRVTGYTLFDSFEEGLKTAIAEAKKLVAQTPPQ